MPLRQLCKNVRWLFFSRIKSTPPEVPGLLAGEISKDLHRVHFLSKPVKGLAEYLAAQLVGTHDSGGRGDAVWQPRVREDMPNLLPH